MEVKSCKIENLFFCIWHEDKAFYIEDVEANISMSLSILQLSWFIETVNDLNKKSEEDYFYKKEKV